MGESVMTRREQRVRGDEVWVRWQRGESVTVIARALGVSHPAIGKRLRRFGGIAPVPQTRSARVLSSAEREEISRGLAIGLSCAVIGRRLRRSTSTVTREVARHAGRQGYRARDADAAAWQRARRPKPCRLATHRPLRQLVIRLLERRWSPEQIAAWLQRTYPDTPDLHVSHETIYRTRFVQSRGVLKRELLQYLRRRGRLRRPRTGRPPSTGPLRDAVSIRERPASVEDRAVPGHWEGDLLTGTIDTQVATLVERQSRYVMLVRLPTKEAPAVAQALARHVRTLPAALRRSLTWDRGRELAAHRDFTMDTDVEVYFCDPHSPWQRGSNENTNGLLRDYLPRGTDLSRYSQAALNRIARELNERPRKTLGFETPAAKLAAIVASTG
jgi:IS30 family transposase